MDASHLLRAARRSAEVSQRELARRAGVDPGVIGAIEAGRRDPGVATLTRLVAPLGLELALVPQRAEADDDLRVWLRANTGDRLLRLLGKERCRALEGMGRGPFVLPPEVSAGLWLPGVPCPDPLPVWVPLFVPCSDTPPGISAIRGPWAVTGLVPVGVGPTHVVLVWPPDAPVMQEDETHGPRLRAAAVLLHDLMRRDLAGRRRAAHRDSDPRREYWWLFHRPQFDKLRELPDARRRRDWRLGGEATLREWLGVRGFRLPDDL